MYRSEALSGVLVISQTPLERLEAVVYKRGVEDSVRGLCRRRFLIL